MASNALQTPLLQISCHCGAITVTASHMPPYLNECQCSICRRYAAQWAYFKVKDVHVNNSSPTTGLENSTLKYVWGDKTSSFEFCKICACVMCWVPIDVKDGEARMGKTAFRTIDDGINARLVTDPTSLQFVEKRITYEDAVKVVDGVYDEKGPIRT